MTPAPAADADLELRIDPETARGRYSNLVMVSHRPSEITLDFAYLEPSNSGVVQARIILTAASARELMTALAVHVDAADAPAPDPR